MSISKIRFKSAVLKHNDKRCQKTTNNTTLPIKATTDKTTNNSISTTFETSLSSSFASGLPKANENKTRNLEISLPSNTEENAVNTTTPLPASTTTTSLTHTATPAVASPSSIETTKIGATSTTLLPQTNLLKTESIVPSLTNRTQKTICRSYSTLTSTTIKKFNSQHVNRNSVNQVEIKHNVKAVADGKVVSSSKCINNVVNGLPKVIKQPTIVHRRPELRGSVIRQRSKSTSSSHSNCNQPLTAAVNVAATPSSRTPCASPYSPTLVQQSNGILRIQRNAKEQEKLPDRINYDKRGLTAIPIFENEINLRLLSLQHNLISTFHIPKERQPEQQKEAQQQQPATVTETTMKEQTINGIPCKSTELNILGNQAHQPFYNSKQRLPLAIAKPNVEQLPSQQPGQLKLPLNTPHIKNPNPMTFGSYIMKHNKLLHRSINTNNCQLNNHKGELQHPTKYRFSIRKSKSFVTDLNLQLNINKRATQNQSSNLLRRKVALVNIKSFDSSTSNITTDSTQSTLLTTEVDESCLEDDAENDKPFGRNSPLLIRNTQLNINYGNIFQNLVFLDLYNNQIERIANIDGLEALSVLLLGKNRISDISGLSSLKSTLRVLDLHGNRLCSISNKINCLKELKSLNLAGNQIRQINHNDFMGLDNLKELNLKRNKLKRINGFQHLVALERLWLCHNDLHKVDDMSTIAKAQNLVEITIENNPLTLAGDCVSFLVSYLPKLQTLSQMPITEQVRKAAMTWRTNKELSAANTNLGNREIFNIIRREEIISNARTNWELLRSQQMLQSAVKQQNAANKANNDVDKTLQNNENNYEEFIKLPPIENLQQQQQTTETNQKETEERSSSASSLGANVNSLSSCYSSQDEDDAGTTSKANKTLNNIDKASSSASPSMKSKAQMENIINHTSATDNNHQHQNENQHPHQHQHQSSHSLSKCNNSAAANNCASTLNLQFPMETSKVPANQQNQAVTLTATSVSSSLSPTQTVATVTVSSSMAVVPPASLALTKRYMTGSLMRSQTIAGTVTSAGDVSSNFAEGSGNGGGYTNGYAVQANNVATANNIRCQSKMNRNATTQIAGITTLQQTITTTTTTIATTPSATTTGNSISAAIANNNLMASSMNSNYTSLTSNTNKTSVTGASNCITGVMAHTTAAMANGPYGAISTKLTAIEREREQGGDYLIEICGRYLNIYGRGALRFIDKQWNPTKANDVHTLNFSYINFNNVALILGRIKVRFLYAENFVFRETNINCLGQLNALAELQGITSLNIEDEGNPITSKDLWRQYAIYRLSHWGLKMLNNIEVSTQEVENANAIFGGLSDLLLWTMPDAMLQPLLARLRLDESCTASKLMPKQWLQKPDNMSLRSVVGKEALQWNKSYNSECLQLPTSQQVRHLQNQYHNSDTFNTNISQTVTSSSGICLSPTSALTSSHATLAARERGKIQFTLMMENTCNAVEKLHKLERIWPNILQNIVRNTLLDYSQLDVYIRNLMAEVMK